MRLCGAPWAGLADPAHPDLAPGLLPWEGARRLWGMVKVQTVRPAAPSGVLGWAGALECKCSPEAVGWGEPDTADSGNEICVVICARSGRGPWALANLSEELRSWGGWAEAEGWWELKHRLEWREHLLECVCVCVGPLGGLYLCLLVFPKCVCLSLVYVDVL